ncbi:MAG: response regulator [Acidobacteria bacterium]|nr:response regulator [Acidobacteriota bacterium]
MAEDQVKLWITIAEAVPKAVLFLAVMVLGIVYRREISQLFRRLEGIDAGPLKFSLKDFESWAAESSKDRDLSITGEAIEAAMNRARRSRDAFAGLKILWADDVPENNFRERRALASLGAQVTVALDNAEAWGLLRRAEYDILISDLGRDNKEDPKEVTARAAAYLYQPAVVFYAMRIPDPMPPEALGAAVAPDKLIHLVTDAAQRRRWTAPE